MKIVLTGGGTAGHVTPNIALLPALRALGAEIHYIGTATGMEYGLIQPTGVPFHPITAGKLRRYLDGKNLTDLGRIAQGFFQAQAILRRLKPDVVFSKGGFVACPVVWAAWSRRIPVIIHESDVTPGLANRLSLPCATRVCYTFPETQRYLRHGQAVLTGIPVRDALLSGQPAAGRAICGFTAAKPVLMALGGSQGSAAINAMVRTALPLLRDEFQVCHLCGKGGVDESLAATPGYYQCEYANEELPDLFAMADLVVTRAGATTLFELLALRKPHLLIPLSAKVSRGDQVLNARSFAAQGYAVVLPEEDLTEQAFIEQIRTLYAQREAYTAAMAHSPCSDGVEAVINVIKGCCP